ncbi:hypothetical protein IHQ68_03370 [Chelatococcus sambhunathii]|uniref:Uncharacterized protein n=1 Tax=Chelatococcus sambhunathii TaxID=363953 RepID=A0ABU1DC37_9HYPH|nr:hypothetical protein [Chelatococcus sambhunathii]MDR4305662.1 hypothetical protein [Chelatococcus sambhunathii]
MKTSADSEQESEHDPAFGLGLAVQLLEQAATREAFEDAAFSIGLALKLLRLRENQRNPRDLSDREAAELTSAVHELRMAARWWDHHEAADALLEGIPAILGMIELRAGKVADADRPEVLQKFHAVREALATYVRSPESVEHDRVRAEKCREQARLAKETPPAAEPRPQSDFAKLRTLPFAAYYNLPATAPGRSQIDAAEENVALAASGEFPVARMSLALRHFVLSAINGEHELVGYDPERFTKRLPWIAVEIIQAAPDLLKTRVFEVLALVDGLAWALYHKRPVPFLVDQLDQIALFASELDVVARRQAISLRGAPLARASLIVHALDAPQGDAALN